VNTAKQLVPAKTSTLPDHISPTSAKNYLGCSLRFFFEKVADIRKGTSPALHLGKSVHTALQYFHLALWRGGDTSENAAVLAFETSFQRFEQTEGPINYPDIAAREKARNAGIALVKAYLASDEIPKNKPRGVEVSLSAHIPGLPVKLTGALDLVESDFTPVDFKTAASRPDADQVAFDHEIQLVTYQLLIEDATEEIPPSLDLLFLVKTKVPQVIRVSIPSASTARKIRVRDLLNRAVEGIVEERFHPQPGMHCSWCSFRNECLKWQASNHR